MKRREFLKTPAVTLLIPAATGLSFEEAFASDDPQAVSTQAEGARKHPQRLHQDFSTYEPGIEYFFLGNGEIQAVVQYSPDRSGELPQTFLGLTLMDAERFSRKWSTYLFHPERGYENSKLYVTVDNRSYSVSPETLTEVKWKLVDTVPVVSIQWKAGDIEVEEELFVPAAGGYLIRQVRVHNTGAGVCPVTLRLPLVPNFTLFDDIGTDPKSRIAFGRGYTEVTLSCVDGESKATGRYEVSTVLAPVAPGAESLARFVYTIRAGTPRLQAKDMPNVWKETVAYWKPKPVLETGDKRLSHMYAVSRSGLKALLARSGKRDGGYWQYNMEWVRDDVMMIQALSMAGMHEEARSLLVKNLSRNVSADGCLVESSRWSGYDYTELDQNGQLVYGAWQYLCWTGDKALIRKYWPQIVRAGDYPLQEVFRGKRTRLLRNKREFWERDDRFGVEDGFELAYQFWVMLGLEKGSTLARELGDAATAKRWEAASLELKQILFEDPTFRFIEEGRLIKRRTLDGRWQRYMIPTNRAAMPPGSPTALNEKPEWEPDSANVYPIIYEFVDPQGEVARNTLQWMDVLWNQQWNFGGYSRYNTTSEPDLPGPWPIASLLMARAAVEMGDDERAWRAIDWVATIHGGKSGGWFERYAPSITPPAPPVSVVGWAWAEVVVLIVQHMMGFRPSLEGITIRPRLIRGVDHLRTTFMVRGGSIDVTVKRSATPAATVNGVRSEVKDGALRIGHPKKGSHTEIVLEVPGR
jgi:hypothetical protein